MRSNDPLFKLKAFTPILMTPTPPIPVLEQTFIHVSGVGPKTESAIWEKGIHTWRQFLTHPGPVLSHTRDVLLRQHLKESLDHRYDICYFSDRLPSREIWRLFGAFKSRAVYLDIETCPMSPDEHDITVIGLFDGKRVLSFVNGRNLDEFEIAIAQYDLVITFNGASFDLPFIRRTFPSISLPPAHIDLRFVLRKLGYRGGLKAIEQEVGICRDILISNMNGYDAVWLWRAYQLGDPAALDTLIQYNTADIVNLEPLMKMAEREMKKRVLPHSSADPIR